MCDDFADPKFAGLSVLEINGRKLHNHVIVPHPVDVYISDCTVLCALDMVFTSVNSSVVITNLNAGDMELNIRCNGNLTIFGGYFKGDVNIYCPGKVCISGVELGENVRFFVQESLKFSEITGNLVLDGSMSLSELEVVDSICNIRLVTSVFNNIFVKASPVDWLDGIRVGKLTISSVRHSLLNLSKTIADVVMISDNSEFDTALIGTKISNCINCDSLIGAVLKV